MSVASRLTERRAAMAREERIEAPAVGRVSISTFTVVIGITRRELGYVALMLSQ